MTTASNNRVVEAEILGSGVFIEFADGKNALFPVSFLYAHCPWYRIDIPPDPVSPVDQEP